MIFKQVLFNDFESMLLQDLIFLDVWITDKKIIELKRTENSVNVILSLALVSWVDWQMEKFCMDSLTHTTHTLTLSLTHTHTHRKREKESE